MTESTTLTVIERAQVALQPAANDKQLAELAAASKSIVTITNADGLKQVHSARMALKNQRLEIERIGKAAREDATAFSKAVIAEERRLLAFIQPEEDRLETLQRAYEAQQEADRRAKAEAERARVQEIQRRLAKLQTLSDIYTSSMPPDRIAEVITQLEGGLTFDYQEFTEEAERSRQSTITALRQAHADSMERIEREDRERAEREAQEARKAAERKAEEERLAEVRRRLDEEKAEQERQAAARRAEEEKQRKEEARIAEIRRWIAALNGPAHLTATHSPALIEIEVNRLIGTVVDERYGEFHAEATQAREAGIERLQELLGAARAHRAEQDRIAAEKAELERQQAEQAQRQAEIERREREAAEAEERRQAEAHAEAKRQREARERAEVVARAKEEARGLLSSLTAKSIAEWIADDLGVELHEVATRIAEIPHADWAALAMGAEQEEEAAA